LYNRAIPLSLNFFKDNWVKSGFGSTFEDFSKSESFYIDLSTDISKPILQPIDYAIRDANYILDVYPKPISIFLSGGIDSQAMVDAFVRTGRVDEFDVVIFEFEKEFNDYDVQWAKDFCKNFKIKFRIERFDVVEFHEKEILDWGVRYKNNSPHILTQIKMISLLSGTTVLGGNALAKDDVGMLVGFGNYSLFGTKRFSEIEQRNVVGMFLMFSPELVYSFTDIPGELNHIEKARKYISGGFRILVPPEKYHGFELLKDYYNQFPNRIYPNIARYYADKYKSNRIYDHLFRHPLMEINKYNNNSVCIPEKRLI
jgi:hypothetical protein